MKRITPLLTLLTGTGMAAVLFAMSAQAAPRTAAPKPVAASPGASTAPPAAEPDQQPTPVDPSKERGRTGTPPSPTPTQTKMTGKWTGRLTGDDGGATIAITARDGEATAYVCDGKRLEIWLRGTAADGKLELKGKKDTTLTGTITDETASGEMVVGVRRWKFTAKPSKGSEPVLYRATAQQRQAGVDGGWIMLPDGGQIGVLTRDGTPTAAPPLDPAFGTTIVDGTTVTAEPVVADPGSGE